MLTFDLIRHAESTWVEEAAKLTVPVFGGRMQHVPLSREGKKQAARFGAFAKSGRIARPDFVFVSPAKRCVQTHQISWAKTGWLAMETEPRDGLLELEWGQFERIRRSIIDERSWKQAIASQGMNFRPPGGESFAQVYRRVTQTMHSISKVVPAGSYCWLHTHQNVIKSVVGTCLNWPMSKLWHEKVAVCSRTRVEYNPRTMRLKLIEFNVPTL